MVFEKLVNQELIINKSNSSSTGPQANGLPQKILEDEQKHWGSINMEEGSNSM